MVKECLQCKKEFYARPSWIAKGRCKFCSKPCYGQWQSLHLNKIKIFDITKWWKENPHRREEANKKKLGKQAWNKGKKLGYLPKNAYKKGQNLGDKHPRWKGGSWIYWKKKVTERDNDICQCTNECPWHIGKCKFSFKGIMEIDHIIPRQKGGQSKFSNLQTLCGNCHNFKSYKAVKPN